MSPFVSVSDSGLEYTEGEEGHCFVHAVQNSLQDRVPTKVWYRHWSTGQRDHSDRRNYNAKIHYAAMRSETRYLSLRIVHHDGQHERCKMRLYNDSGFLLPRSAFGIRHSARVIYQVVAYFARFPFSAHP